ncbi:MAG: hypothetical protein ISP49_02960 [Reyranella sp.]|nr:hypothetical protein [Reyranella sp.]MBL6650524.1 hypothetical protein [Reyranella sp.]
MARSWVNVLLIAGSVALCTVAAEFLVRQLDAAEGDGGASRHLNEIPVAAGVDRAWFAVDPPPLPNRKDVPKEWVELVQKVDESGITEGTRRADMFKAWNVNFVGGDPCRHPYLCGAPGHLFVYDPGNGEARPPYRFLPNATTPIRLVTNQYGFRGPPVPYERQPRTVRIAFIGASTTVGSHFHPYSYPEFVGHWLNMWAAATKRDVTFEVLNAGRESISSRDNVAIARDEVLPLRPDLLVYYEGANQFDLRTMATGLPATRPSSSEVCPARQAKGQAEGGQTDGGQAGRGCNFGDWLSGLSRNSALVRRVEALFAAPSLTKGEGEPAKPDYKLAWPQGLDEKDPDIARTDLPVNLSTILHDLDSIRTASASVGAELALASFIWLVKDGMVLDPIRHRAILDYLNQGYAPFRYRDLERMAAFENRAFAKYARVNKLDFIDVARRMPFDPDLYLDAIHNTYAGERLRAWVFFQGLVPIIDRHLESGAWPRKVEASDRPAPAYKPWPITFTCAAKS